MKRFLIALSILFLTAGALQAAESCTFTYAKSGGIDRVEIAWTTDSSGDFTATSTQDGDGDDYEINGWLIGVRTNPDDTDAPTDNYDIVLTSASGRNICGDTGTGNSPNEDGVLSNLDTANTEYTEFLNNGNYGGFPHEGTITVDITSAGNSNSGVITIFYLRD